MRVRVTGVDHVGRSFDRLAEQAGDLDSLREVAQRARDLLGTFSPRLTGQLAASWQVTSDLGQSAAGTELVYGAVQNFGGYHNITGLHFVEKAAEQAEGVTEPLVINELTGLIRRLD